MTNSPNHIPPPSEQTQPNLNDTLFRTLVETSADAIALVTAEGTFAYLNPAVTTILGFTPAELLGRSCLDLFPPDVVNTTLEKFQSITHTAGATVRVEHLARHKDGSVRWLESITTNLLHDPTVNAFISTFRDITERKEAEARTRENEARLRSIFEASMIGIGFWDSRGYLLDVNDTFLTMLGYDRNDWRDNKIPWAEITPPEYAERDQYAMAENAVQGYCTPYEKEFCRKDGSRVPVLASGGLLPGSPDQGCFFVLDITELKKAQQSVKENKEQLEVILKNIADGITVQDIQGRLIYVNQAAAQLTEYPSVEAMLSAPPLEYVEKFTITDEAGNPFPPSLLPGRRAILGEENPQSTLRYTSKQTGETRWVIIKSTAIFDDQNRPYLVINALQDITQLKEAEQRKDDFISMASHELKTPVTSLKGFTQLLRKLLEKEQRQEHLLADRLSEASHFLSDRLSEASRESGVGDRNTKEPILYLSKMEAQINKLTKLVTDLLDISRMQTQKIHYQEETFPFDDLVTEIVEEIQHTSSKHHILLEGKAHQVITGDRDRLGQVLTNLLTNAIKYSPQAEKVIIRVTGATDKITVQVQDFGIGIPREHQDKIFERFYRVYNEKDRTYPGLGIGLYIAHQIIQHHHGSLWIKSVEGQGSTFSFTLPCQRTAEREEKDLNQEMRLGKA